MRGLILFTTIFIFLDKVAIHNSIILNGCSRNITKDGKDDDKDCNCKSTKLKFLGKNSCEIAPLPKCLEGHSIIINRDGELMVLGGNKARFKDVMFQDCLVYKKNRWVHHSTLNRPKYFSITITMPNGIYVFGAQAYEQDSGTTAEFLGNGEYQWEELDTNIPSPGLSSSDGVAISDEGIIFTGGIGMMDGMIFDSSYRIRTFNVKTNKWTFDGKLFEDRWHHKSFIFNDKVIVCGGMNWRLGHDFRLQNKILNSTEIISIHSKEVRKAGNLNEARFCIGMGILVIDGVPTLAAFGGLGAVNVWLSSVELWDDANECWIMSEMRLPGPGYTVTSCSSMYKDI